MLRVLWPLKLIATRSGIPARTILELHKRAVNSAEWKTGVPPVPMQIAASSYRAPGKDYKRKGEIEQAKATFERLMETGFATDNDQRILAKLRELSPTGCNKDEGTL